MDAHQNGVEYGKFYDANLESYLIDEVGKRFQDSGEIEALDFCLILSWKSVRAVGYHKKRLRERAHGTLTCAVGRIAKELHDAADSKNRLRLLMQNWGFRLPTATAILTILFPEHFTVYDRRVCAELHDFTKLQDHRFTNRLWEQYLAFKARVEEATPPQLSLRDKDRYLWGKSFYEQVARDCH